MQNKGAVWTFTILLTLACLFQISYSWVTNGVEKRAEEEALVQLDSIRGTKQESITYGNETFNLNKEIDVENLTRRLEEDYLKKVAHEPAYPLLGESYQDCKKRELSLGLDLKGGMAVALEVSIPDLVANLAGNSREPNFVKAYGAALEKFNNTVGESFIDLFCDEYIAQNPNGRLASVFGKVNSDKFNKNMSNEDVRAKLMEEREAAMSNIEQIMNNRINKFGVSNASIQRQVGSGRILIELPGVKDKERVRNLLQSTANLEFWETYHNHEVFQALENANMALSKALYAEELTTEVAEDTNKVVEDGTEEVVAEATEDVTATAVVENDSAKKVQDSLNALAATDTAKTPADTNLSREEQLKKAPLYRYLNLAIYQAQQGGGYTWERGSRVGTCSVADTAKLNALLNNPAAKNAFPKDLRLLWGAKPENVNGSGTDQVSLYAIKVTTKNQKAPLDGSVITEARYDFNQFNGAVEVVMQMNGEGSEKWARMTKKAASNQNASIAIVMDDAVYSAPTVNGEITGGRSSISGNFTMDEANDLANVLKSGTLPAKAKIVDEVIVGPTLGASNIEAGISSFLVALLVVLAYMVIYYNRAGLIANVALIANLFFLFGSLASIQASLTLPGIAGIVLTIGMAVDANVLIFERIREELREGKGIKVAVNDGFKKALSSIIDGNLTTLLTAIVLATFGSGPILGFATTLIIGIFTSLFSAIFVSRLIITELLERKKTISFSTKMTENVFANSKINFLGKRKMYYFISGAIIIAGIASLAMRGLDYGVEFTGGRTYEVKFEQEADYEAIKDKLAAQFVAEDGQKLAPEVKMIENKFKAKITTKYLFNSDTPEADSIVEAKLREGLTSFGTFEIEGQRKVDAVITGELIRDSLFSIIFSLIIIFSYIVFRFQKWQFGLAAVGALFHDVLVVLGLFSIFYGMMPFSMEIDQAFIAAILTVVGYSINDTVVVFDRIREYLREHKRMETENLLNSALNSTLSRTLNTSLTTFIVLLVIFLFGGDSIKGFTFALLIGVGVGTYSSLFVASPMVYDLASKGLNNNPSKEKK